MGTFLQAEKPLIHQADQPPLIHHFFSPQFWVEGKALQQLQQLGSMPGMSEIAAFPDLHPGKYGPVGVACLSNTLYPQLIGNDIGCGMSLFILDLAPHKLRRDKAAKLLRKLEQPWDGNAALELEKMHLPTDLDAGLATIGGGNHFVELQMVDHHIEEGGLDKGRVYLLVHSGSRGVGTSVFNRFMPDSIQGLSVSDEQTQFYMQAHDIAVRWAQLNRRLIADYAAQLLHTQAQLVADVPHNLVQNTPSGFLHRKGAAVVDKGLIPIAGSRATLSYVVSPSQKAAQALHSASHGAGRKYDRSFMLKRSRTDKHTYEQLQRNPWGGHVVCDDKRLLVEEQASAYKDAGQVVEQLKQHDIIRPIAAMRPLVTFKCGSQNQENHKQIVMQQRSKNSRKTMRRGDYDQR